MAKEAVFGTAVTPTTFEPFEACTLEAEPGTFSPKVMFGQRDEQAYMMQGESKYTGNVEGPLFPVNGIPLLVAAIGYDGGSATMPGGAAVTQGNGVTGTNGNTKNGTIGVIAAGVTSVTYTAVTGGAPVVGDIFQFDVNLASTTTAEVRKVTAVSGIGPYTLTLDVATNFAHAAAAPAKNVVAPFTHTIFQSNLLPSLTIEKNLANKQSQQFYGCRVSKFNLKMAVGETPALFTADIVALGVNTLDSPSAIAVDSTIPFNFANATLTNPFTSDAVTQATGIQIDLDNGIKPTYTFSGGHGPKFITPVSRKVAGNFSVVFDSLDDSTWGYQTFMSNQTQGNLVLNLLQPAGLGSNQVQITLSQINLIKDPIAPKFGEVLMEQVDFTGSLKLSTMTTVGAVIANSIYLPY
ncbi:MAG: hypothetical protein KGL39_24230 [Patescibacteria group bacterium]|nr:hypothetical protein [Patescibacteria group bacterium]